MRYRCPDQPRWTDDITGCGCTFEAEPDFEGMVDCPHCGMWHNPETDATEVPA
jgi:hypothetical protein